MILKEMLQEVQHGQVTEEVTAFVVTVLRLISLGNQCADISLNNRAENVCVQMGQMTSVPDRPVRSSDF